jgi:tetratricopeptide (TPR) repeat protein
MRVTAVLVVPLLVLSCGGASQSGRPSEPAGARAPLLEGLGDYHRAIATNSPEAQRYVDQGLRLIFAFNYDEAVRSFREAGQLDPDCAPCAWGYTLALGPYNNDPMRQRPGAVAAAEHAIEIATAHGTALDRQLAQALRKRLAEPAPEDRTALNEAYANAMREIANAFPDDVDVADLTAEALFMTMPLEGAWKPDGTPTSPAVAEARALEERGLAASPNHPGLNHLYIHTLEGSLTDRPKAAHAAEVLMTAMSGAGHMLHMPSHIFIRIGRLAEAEEANRRAIAADRAYLAAHDPGGTYPVMIHHNESVLWAVLMMRGESREAIGLTKPMAEAFSHVIHQAPPVMREIARNSIATLLPVTLVRFARWKEVLAMEAPDADLTGGLVVHHWARGLALVAGRQLDQADAELKAIEPLQAKFPTEMPMAMFRPILDLCHEQLAGALAEARRDHDQAIAHLQRAASAEDQLPPDAEPPIWNMPSRHMLGAVLLAAGKAHDAEAVYREDLRRSPENGWGLAGLAAALRAQKSPEAAEIERRFAEAWKAADVKTTGSLLP